MDVLKNKTYTSYDYISRYASVPNYYHVQDSRNINGIGNNLIKHNNFILHELTPTDTLDKLALKYYNNPTFWWIIAYFNDIQDAFINLRDFYTTLKIPQINDISFGELR